MLKGCRHAVVECLAMCLMGCLLPYTSENSSSRNCLKSRSVVSRAQKSPAYRSEMSPFAPFRRLLTPSFCGRPDFLDSFSKHFTE
jgi:hypothetical protein